MSLNGLQLWFVAAVVLALVGGQHHSASRIDLRLRPAQGFKTVYGEMGACVLDSALPLLHAISMMGQCPAFTTTQTQDGLGCSRKEVNDIAHQLTLRTKSCCTRGHRPKSARSLCHKLTKPLMTQLTQFKHEVQLCTQEEMQCNTLRHQFRICGRMGAAKGSQPTVSSVDDDLSDDEHPGEDGGSDAASRSRACVAALAPHPQDDDDDYYGTGRGAAPSLETMLPTYEAMVKAARKLYAHGHRPDADPTPTATKLLTPCKAKALGAGRRLRWGGGPAALAAVTASDFECLQGALDASAAEATAAIAIEGALQHAATFKAAAAAPASAAGDPLRLGQVAEEEGNRLRLRQVAEEKASREALRVSERRVSVSQT